MTDTFRNKHNTVKSFAGMGLCQQRDYYITMVTAGRDRLFGDIVNGEMVLNDLGKLFMMNLF